MHDHGSTNRGVCEIRQFFNGYQMHAPWKTCGKDQMEAKSGTMFLEADIHVEECKTHSIGVTTSAHSEVLNGVIILVFPQVMIHFFR